MLKLQFKMQVQKKYLLFSWRIGDKFAYLLSLSLPQKSSENLRRITLINDWIFRQHWLLQLLADNRPWAVVVEVIWQSVRFMVGSSHYLRGLKLQTVLYQGEQLDLCTSLFILIQRGPKVVTSIISIVFSYSDWRGFSF